MPIFDHFNLIAPYYDRVLGGDNREHWLRLLDISPGARLLDAGGGTGRVSEMLGCPSCTIIVADASRGMLREAAGKPGLIPVQAEAETLPFPPASFDRILMVDALHHVADQARTVAQLWQALKPGGRLLIEEPDVRQFAVKLIALGEKLLLMRSHFLPPERIEALLRSLGAQVSVELVGANALLLAVKGIPSSFDPKTPHSNMGDIPR